MRWSPEEERALAGIYGTVPYERVYALFPNRSKESVKRKASALGLALSVSEAARIRGTQHLVEYWKGSAVVDHRFFSDVTVESAYWAGFLAADGSVDDRRNRITICLAGRDCSVLERLLLDVKSNNSIYLDRKRNQVSVHIYSSEWVKDLALNFNIGPRKSLTLMPPNLRVDETRKAYIVGLIDGDGSFSIQKKARTDYKYLRLKLVGTKTVLDWVKDEIGEPKQKVRSAGSIYELVFVGSKAEKIKSELLKVDVPRLQRKWVV